MKEKIFNPKETFTFPVKIEGKKISDTFISAWEGGSSYWCSCAKMEFPKGYRKISSFPSQQAYECIVSGGTLYMEDKEEDKKFQVSGGQAKIEQTLKIMAEKHVKHFADLVNGTDDAITADVFFQLLCFGELIYG